MSPFFSEEKALKKILIVGGGVAGLGAAYKVARAASEGHDVEFVLFEKDPRLGGKICTEIVRDASEDKFIVDGGPDCFLTEKPACHRIAKILGIFDDELPTDESRKRTWILSRGKLHQMPDGIFMFAPTKFSNVSSFSSPGTTFIGGMKRSMAIRILPGHENRRVVANGRNFVGANMKMPSGIW